MKTFKQIVQEKKLTPAEKKKREEVAQAIERDNPDMPMAKKMAIATATAKKVAEASVTTLSNYMRKSAADAAKPGASARRQDKRIGGQKMADDKIRKMQGKSSASKIAATSGVDEETAQKLVKVYNSLNSTNAEIFNQKLENGGKDLQDMINFANKIVG